MDKNKRKAAKISAANDIRARIRERMSFLHTNQDAIDKKCGFGHGFLNDFRTRDIRKLIDRNIKEIESFGICATVAQTSGPAGGRPATEYWLNEEQALLVSILSNARNAPAVRAMLIKTFVAWRRGQLEPRRVERAPATRKQIRGRDDLSFTRRNNRGNLENWAEPPIENSWHRAYGVGEVWFAEIIALARHKPQEAYNAMRFAGQVMLPRLEAGSGHAEGFFSQMARWALIGIVGPNVLTVDLIKSESLAIHPDDDDRRFL